VAGGERPGRGATAPAGNEIDRRLTEANELLGRVASRVARRLGKYVDVEDLEAIGREALLPIVTSWDPARADFRTYVALKLRWAIYDGLRRETHARVPAVRAVALMASERLSGALTPEAEAPPTEEAYEDRLRALLEGHAAALAVGLVAAAGDLAVVADEATGPEDRAAGSQVAVALRRAVGTLPERERALIERHYFRGEQFDAIAADLGISKSWASRLHAQAILALGRVLRELGVEGP
jgi:RNA polymerase sigma factor FliA